MTIFQKIEIKEIDYLLEIEKLTLWIRLRIDSGKSEFEKSVL